MLSAPFDKGLNWEQEGGAVSPSGVAKAWMVGLGGECSPLDSFLDLNYWVCLSRRIKLIK